ncbi:MAG: hypothetical protein Q4D53_01065 [Leptotrichiaceae bacterium]|nr:hypothetical protein [Leptotrichiaceae bacterium]
MKLKLNLLVIFVLMLGVIGFGAEKKFGSSVVGYIIQPQGFKMSEYKPTPASMALTNDSETIVLDGTTGDAENALQIAHDTFLSRGIDNKAIVVFPSTFGNYPSKTLMVGLGNGEMTVLSFIDYKGKVYMVQIAGKSEKVRELHLSLGKSWSPK